METRYCDTFRPVDEDAYLRDFIRAVEHKDLSYVEFIFPIIKDQQKTVLQEVDSCGHYLQLSREDSGMYDKVLSHGLMLAAHHGCMPITRYLLKQGVNVNAQNESGCTALIKACERGHIDVVKALMEYGADINQTNLVGSTALQWVTRMTEQRLNIVDLLLSYDGIRVDQATHKRGRTALHCAAENDLTGQICKSLLDKPARVNIQDKEGITPLHLAAERGLLDNVKVLVKYGAHINIHTSQFGLTAVHIAMQQAHVDTAILLMVSGANVEITDTFEQTAVERMKKYAKLATDPATQKKYSLLEDYVKNELPLVRKTEVERMKRVFNVLCELISEDNDWTYLFMELLECGEDGVDKLEEAISCLPLRSSEASLSVLLLHLFNFWLNEFPNTATFWILMRALRDHGMSYQADNMIQEFVSD